MQADSKTNPDGRPPAGTLDTTLQPTTAPKTAPTAKPPKRGWGDTYSEFKSSQTYGKFSQSAQVGKAVAYSGIKYSGRAYVELSKVVTDCVLSAIGAASAIAIPKYLGPAFLKLPLVSEAKSYSPTNYLPFTLSMDPVEAAALLGTYTLGDSGLSCVKDLESPRWKLATRIGLGSISYLATYYLYPMLASNQAKENTAAPQNISGTQIPAAVCLLTALIAFQTWKAFRKTSPKDGEDDALAGIGKGKKLKPIGDELGLAVNQKRKSHGCGCLRTSWQVAKAVPAIAVTGIAAGAKMGYDKLPSLRATKIDVATMRSHTEMSRELADLNHFELELRGLHQFLSERKNKEALLDLDNGRVLTGTVELFGPGNREQLQPPTIVTFSVTKLQLLGWQELYTQKMASLEQKMTAIHNALRSLNSQQRDRRALLVGERANIEVERHSLTAILERLNLISKMINPEPTKKLRRVGSQKEDTGLGVERKYKANSEEEKEVSSDEENKGAKKRERKETKKKTERRPLLSLGVPDFTQGGTEGTDRGKKDEEKED